MDNNFVVYVDELKPSSPYNSQTWRYKTFCHMVSDDLNSLHSMAQRLGLRTTYFQYQPRLWLCHYDLTESKRNMALKYGAVEITSREWITRHLHG